MLENRTNSMSDELVEVMEEIGEFVQCVGEKNKFNE